MNIERIDTRFGGLEGAVCCHRAGDVLVDCGPAAVAENVIAAMGDDEPRVLLLTHIHLDHSGGTGALVKRYPDLKVYVHESVVRHLVDPTRLLASATRIFGELDEKFGTTLPVPAENITALNDGDVIEGFEVIHTPGHAGSHLAFLQQDTGIALIGDAAGEAVEGDEIVLMPTAPPELDVELWLASIDRLAERSPGELGLTHFGRITDVEGAFERAREDLRRGAELARQTDEAGFVEHLRQQLKASPPAVARALEYASPPLPQLWAGYDRYWAKKIDA
jgi:glyoxylase-like metal-dependent hydrolase (beta-lactamase superfamily II)